MGLRLRFFSLGKEQAELMNAHGLGLAVKMGS